MRLLRIALGRMLNFRFREEIETLRGKVGFWVKAMRGYVYPHILFMGAR